VQGDSHEDHHDNNDNDNNSNNNNNYIYPGRGNKTPPRLTPLQPPRAAPGTRTMGHSPPPFRQSATFPAGDLPILSEKAGAPKADGAGLHKRYSDETKESKIPSMLRKKSGFSGFMNSLVGSPKKPLISAPVDPVHVTHVGYDSSTGQFTVRGFTFSFFVLWANMLTRSTGAAKGVAATYQ
jgi:p21-activated kinase 1